MNSSYPIDSIYDHFCHYWLKQPLVISAPTASGKSTQIPRWCKAQGDHSTNVLVIEPRRVACRSLAQYVAQLEACRLGTTVGYHVRDDVCKSKSTQILFVTPGIALHLWKINQFKSFQAVIIDEFHERTLSLDLLLALSLSHPSFQLIVMSATFAAQQLCDYMNAVHLEGKGRQFPVKHQYRPGQQQEPYRQNLNERIQKVVQEAYHNHSGDLLVFLPGKKEIYDCQRIIQNTREIDAEVLALHASLTLQQQSQIFIRNTESKHRRIILSTNVAETSVTVPNIHVVIDSGLLRQSRHEHGRSVLGLTTIAQDSADQRAGRAGRLQAGHCYRMWGQGVSLAAYTKPEIHRESLIPLVLSALACGHDPRSLTWLNQPYMKALDQAFDTLQRLDAIDEQGHMSSMGALLFEVGIDVLWGRWLIQAQQTQCLIDMIDLLSALLSKHHLLYAIDPHSFYQDPLRKQQCDAIALIKAVRLPAYECEAYAVDPHAWSEAQLHRKRLHQCFEFALMDEELFPSIDTAINRKRLIQTLLAVDAQSVYIARKRKKHWAWCSSSHDIAWGRQSISYQAVEHGSLSAVDAFIVLDQHTVMRQSKSSISTAHAVLCVSLQDLEQANLGQQQMAGSSIVHGELYAEVHRVFAGKTLSTEVCHVEGLLAQQTLCHAIMHKKVWRSLLDDLPLALHYQQIKQQQEQSSQHYQAALYQTEAWIMHRLQALGFEDTQDFILLDDSDLLPKIDDYSKEMIDRDFPYMIKLSDAHYKCTYNLYKKRCLMEQISGKRKTAPQAHVLPKCKGFEIRLQQGQHSTSIRAKRN